MRGRGEGGEDGAPGGQGGDGDYVRRLLNDQGRWGRAQR